MQLTVSAELDDLLVETWHALKFAPRECRDDFDYVMRVRTEEEKAINETREQRAKWFQQSLDELDALNLQKDVAVPYGIGCNLGGGIWEEYCEMLRKAKTRFVIVKM
jgi:hypothetical protein